MTKISIIVNCHNGTKYLNKCRYPYKNRRKIRDIENELLAQIELTPIYIKN